MMIWVREMNVVFVTPTQAEQLALKGSELCSNDNIYVVLTSQSFRRIENVTMPQNAKIVYFSLIRGTYSKAYVCNGDKLEVKYNNETKIRDYYYYYDNVLVVDLRGYNITIDRMLNYKFSSYGLTTNEETYILEGPIGWLIGLYRTRHRPLFTSFMSEPDPDDDRFTVFLLKIQDICIIHMQRIEGYNILLPLCNKKPLIYLGEGASAFTRLTRSIINGGFSIKRYTPFPYFKFSRSQ